MVDKLDQSLDTIMTDRKKNQPRRAGRPARRAVSGVQKTAAPVGGVKKAERPAKQNQRAAAPAAGGAGGESKISVSNLVSCLMKLKLGSLS